MRKLVVSLTLAVLFSLPVLAQDKAEVFGGYQYSRLSSTNFNGWNGAFTGNLNNWLGVTADLSGAYKSQAGTSFQQHNFLFGPTVSYRKLESVKPFAHALFGVAHANAAFSGLGASDNSFAMALGGGVDASITHRFSLRLVQADWMRTSFGSVGQNNARISTGIVFKF